MDHDTSGNVVGILCGIFLGIGSYLLKMDWNAFVEQLGTKGIEVAVLGMIGGAAGLLGKKIVERIFFKKKRKKDVGKDQ